MFAAHFNEGDTVQTTQSVLDHHLDCFGRADVPGIMSDYAEDAALITPDGLFKGKEAIRAFFVEGFKEFSKASNFAMKKVVVDGECAFIFWDAETPNLRFESASDTFIVRGGRIVYQTFAAKVSPKR